ncbi:hypothetical protein AJ80_09692 [Polytolypa hystricis UAMH7299]|uniref:Uncharacterized protein n=1 Tax=Polytolypa hystricis (strain UAMH7299) TaxID=1447883 RepID=A0A2B7WDL1_POLH7|nr:hypothetical protein AJ80_09692 [Polytolypa hystricis UAMH7299]
MLFPIFFLLPSVLGNQQYDTKCTRERQGIASGYIEEVAEKFCSYVDNTTLPELKVSYPGSTASARDSLKPENMVNLGWRKSEGDCPGGCLNAFTKMIKTCCHDANCFWAGAGFIQETCGTYTLNVTGQATPTTSADPAAASILTPGVIAWIAKILMKALSTSSAKD